MIPKMKILAAELERLLKMEVRERNDKKW